MRRRPDRAPRQSREPGRAGRRAAGRRPRSRAGHCHGPRRHFAAPPKQVWPWLVQLGNGRAGWYFPASVERGIPAQRRGLHHLEPALQRLTVGDRIGDWGPGDPEFRAELIDPPHALVWSSLRQRSRGHRWPEGDLQPWTPGLPDDVLALSWALVLRPLAGGMAAGERSRLQLRLRARSRSRLKPLWQVAGGVLDWLTVRMLLAGLRDRLAAHQRMS